MLSVEKAGGVARVTLNRPEARNAFDDALIASLTKTFREIENDKTVRVVILAGNGPAFCAGADLKGVAVGRGNAVRETGDGPMGPTRMLLSKPVIAAVEGHAVAGGLELALWCDLRVAAHDAVFGVFCRRWGVPLVDGGTIRLPRLVGHSHALDIILTGRGVAGEEAQRIGLANRLVQPGTALPEAVTLAKALSALPQRCLREDRLSSYEQWPLPLDAAIANELRHGMRVLASGESLEGAARFAAGAGRHGAPA